MLRPTSASAPVLPRASSSSTRPRMRVRLWLLTVAFIVYGTTIPFHFVDNPALVREKLSRVTLNPLISPETGRRVSIPDVVQNVLLFVPFGLLAMSSLRRRPLVVRLAIVTGAGALLSGAVEVLQLFTIERTTSVSDLAANSLGALLGAVAWPVVVAIATMSAVYADRRRWTRAPAFYPLVVALLLLCVSAWEPFDPSLDVGAIWSKLKTFRADPWQVSAITGDELLQAFRYAAAVIAGAFTFTQLGLSAPAARAATLCIVLGATLEASQLFVESRMPALEDVLVCVVGALAGVGVFMARKRMKSPGGWYACVAAATVLGAIVMYLAPFKFAETHRSGGWLPFLSYYQYTSTEAVSHVFELVLLYLPLGFAAAAAAPPSTPSTRLTPSFLLALGTAAVLEYLQGWIVGRYPDVTDVGVALLGWSAGVWMGGTGWSRFRDRLAISIPSGAAAATAPVKRRRTSRMSSSSRPRLPNRVTRDPS